MGVSDLRDAFNSVSQPAYTCTSALLRYELVREVESQILHFSGIAADGTSFDIASEPLRPGVAVNEAAKVVAQKLLDRTV